MMGTRPPPAPLRPGEREATLALAHALRTPLTSLTLGLGLLDDGALGPLTEAQREVVRSLVADVARLALLVDRELQIDRLGTYAGPVERTAVDLGRLVSAAAEPIERQARPRGVTLILDVPDGLVIVADPVKVSWVAASLMGNALRYSPDYASISVRLSRRRDEAELVVSDQGPGVSEGARASLFDRGGGQGLFLAREIIEAHGGRIEVRSDPGHGSVFTVGLPIRPT
jgi:signal transduction histidine kinase